ncbi:interleukin-18-like [Lissotriton helveticus]
MAASNDSVTESSKSMRTPHGFAPPDFKGRIPKTETVKVKNIHEDILVAVPEPSEANPRPVFYSSKLESTHEFDVFYLTNYKNTDNHPGVAVSFNVNIDQKSYMLCSMEPNGQIRFTCEEIPETIDGSSSKFIFFQTAFSTNSPYYKFESSLFRGSYMASEIVNNNNYLSLKPFSDLVPEICRFAIDKV